jgi:uncharacterized protein (UPF0276 family)
MKALGVGAVWSPALHPLFEAGGADLPVLELEPQILWQQVRDADGWHYRHDAARLERIAALPCAKLVHGIGQPLGGSVADPLAHHALLRHAIEALDPPWCSEHLSFNRVRRAGAVEHAGFLLPPPQTAASARVAADNIRAYGRHLDRPVAFETGVNYLRPGAGELGDGDFFAAVARQAGCGILLDLHNLWCNERNGRARVDEVLARLPAERIWEIHLAGGMELHGYRLDAHSGAIPAEVLDIAARILPTLPNLGALVFEILPEHVPRFGIDGVQRQIESLQRLWRLRPPRRIRVARAARRGHAPRATRADVDEVAAFEADLVDALRDTPASRPRIARLRDDPGHAVLRELVHDARRAGLAQAMRYTVTLLLLGLGARETLALLDTFMAAFPPEAFNAVEAEQFARYLRTRLPLARPVPHLEEVLAFEHALLRAALHGESSEVAWTVEPGALLEALEAGRLPKHSTPVASTLQVCAGAA